MIHIILGTKAQMVKMAPVFRRLEETGIVCNFIFTGQHQETIDDLRRDFGIKSPDYVLHRGKDVTSIAYMSYWAIKAILHTLINRKAVFKGGAPGIVLVHGDTFSTLLGALLGRLCGMKVGHIESGLRSFNLFHPFPEELTRLVVFKLSDYLFCPGRWALENVAKNSAQKVDTHYNTLLDAVRFAWENRPEQPFQPRFSKYCVISTHRFENWVSKGAASRNLTLIEQIVACVPGVFVAHPVTVRKLREYRLIDRLVENPNIEIRERSDFSRFIELLRKAEFMVTDGGSNQEECSYIGKPCLLLRRASERQEGLENTVVISHYDAAIVADFLLSYRARRGSMLLEVVSPSEIVVESLKDFV